MSNIKYAQKDGQSTNLAVKESQRVQNLKEKGEKSKYCKLKFIQASEI